MTIYYTRAKKILSTYINDLSFYDDSFVKTEIILKEACPKILKEKPVIQSSRICAYAFDLVNFLEWDNKHDCILLIRMALAKINLIRITALAINLQLYPDILHSLSAFIFKPIVLTQTYSQEILDAITLCLCAITTAYRENLDLSNLPTKGPNVRYYNISRRNINKNFSTHKNDYFIQKTTGPIVSPKDNVNKMVQQLYKDHNQFLLQAEQENNPAKIIELYNKLDKFQLEIEALEQYITDHQIPINNITKRTIKTLKIFPEQLEQIIEEKLTKPNKPTPAGSARRYLK